MATKPINRKTRDTGPKKTVKRSSKPRGEKATPVALGEARIFSMAGKEVGSVALPEALFGAVWNTDLVHQVTTALAANKRQNRAHTKNRAEVAGGGKKPWKQKGTGQARHGSTRSPIWRHGGVTFGPRVERDYHEKLNRKMKASALRSVLSRKAKDGELILVDKFDFAAPKTAEGKKSIVALGQAFTGANFKNNNAVLVALASYEPNAIKSFRNMGNVATEEVRNLDALTVMNYRYLVIENPEKSFAALTARTK